MKKRILVAGIIYCASICTVSGFFSPGFYTHVAHASSISDTFSEKYNSLYPSKNSSVRSDYLFEQIALGSEYTVRLLDQMNERNLSLDDKVDQLIEKFDILIDQNQKIIELLEKQKSQGE